MPPQIVAFLPIIGTVLSIGVTLGTLYFALHGGYSKAAGEMQEKVIDALKERVELLNTKIEDMEKNELRQNNILSTIRYALKQRGLKIVIEGDFVTLSEAGGKSSKVVRIQDRATDDETDAS